MPVSTDQSHVRSGTNFIAGSSLFWLLIPMAAMAVGLSTETMLPGVYMDAVNPDYIAVRALTITTPSLPHWLLPGNLLLGRFPVLDNVYYGSLPFWIGLPFYALFGTDVVGIRITHAAFAFLVIVTGWTMLVRMGARPWIATLFLAAMALDPAFQFIFRTQFYIVALSGAFLFLSLSLARPSSDEVAPKSMVLSGVAAGIAAYGHFIFYFYAAIVGVFHLLAARRRAMRWAIGVALGLTPVLIGLVLFVLAVGNVAVPFQQARALSAPVENAGLLDRLMHVFNFWQLAYSGQGANIMMLGDRIEFPRSLGLRSWVLIGVPLAIVAVNEILRKPNRNLRLLLALAVVTPLIYGTMFDSRLWVHHFVPVVALFYCFAALAFSTAIDALGRKTRAFSLATTALLAGLALTNASNFHTVIDRLRATGGVGLVSDAITRFSSSAVGDKALYVMPDWGVFMQFEMVTRGQTPLTLDFNPEWIRGHVCKGNDVVVASLGPGAEAKSRERALAVGLTGAETAIFSQRDGTPIVYAVRWRSKLAIGAGRSSC